MKNLVFLPIIMLLVFSCRKDCSIKIIPEEDIALTVKAFYDSEWGGIKEQIQNCIEIYECLTESGCTVPEEYMDTVYYVFESGDIRHEKEVLYQWWFEENNIPELTELKFNIYLLGDFFHPDFNYSYTSRTGELLMINVKDHLLENYYSVEFILNRKRGTYINEEFNQVLESILNFQLKIDKSDNEIRDHSFYDRIYTQYDHPCSVHSYGYDLHQSYQILFSIK